MTDVAANELVMRIVTLIFTILGIVIGGGILALLTVLVKTLINNHTELVIIRDRLGLITKDLKPIPKLDRDVNHLWQVLKGKPRPQTSEGDE